MAATTLLTSEQFLALPEEFDKHGNVVRKELIHGEVIAMARPVQRHSIIQANILEALIMYFGANSELGFKALPEAEFVVSVDDALVPDVSIIAISRLNPQEQKYIQGAPDIAVEVVSPSESAAYLRIKIGAYLANGSKSVWIVFPEVRSVMIYTRDSIREVQAGETVTDPLLPGFSCPVAAFSELT